MLEPWLRAISPTAFVGILAFMGTVLTVIWTNHAASQRLELQLSAERRRDEASRLFESRRQVYLDAAEVLTIGTVCIGRLANLSSSSQEITEQYLLKSGSLGKVHLLGSPRLGKSIIASTTKIGSTISRITFARTSLDVKHGKIKMLEASASSDNDMSEQVASLWRELIPEQLKLAEMCLHAAKNIAPHIAETILAIREDLHMPPYVGDLAAEFDRVATQQITNFRPEVDKMLAALDLPRAVWET